MSRLFTLRHRGEQTFAGVFRMTGHETYQEVSRDIVHHADDVREIHSVREILSIGIDVLTQKRDVPVACFHQAARLSQHVLGSAAALAAADVGDYAV